VTTVVLSDLHLGSGGEVDVLRRSEIRESLWPALKAADQVVLLGDVVELRDRPLREAVAIARPFFSELAEASGGARLVVVPGNHDHHLLADWFEQRQLAGTDPLGLDERVPIAGSPLAELCRDVPEDAVELAYPGVWIRPGVYATHGHYLDRHLTVPTFERLAVAAVERVLGGDPEAGLAEPNPDTSTPDDYERAQAPVYAFLFALAQAGATTDRTGANPSARVWQALGGGYGRAAKLRGWLLGTVALPGAVGVANRLGLGPVRSDLSPGAITRAGLAAITEVARRLDIGAEHLIFGHTHRRGPGDGETGWRLHEGTRLWNTGSWVYAPGLAGRRPGGSPYWPGTIAVIEDEGPPSLHHLLDERAAEELSRGVRVPASE
jgi:hypothetical protein